MRENQEPIADLSMSSFIRYRRLQMPRMGNATYKREIKPRSEREILDRLFPNWGVYHNNKPAKNKTGSCTGSLTGSTYSTGSIHSTGSDSSATGSVGSFSDYNTGSSSGYTGSRLGSLGSYTKEYTGHEKEIDMSHMTDRDSLGGCTSSDESSLSMSHPTSENESANDSAMDPGSSSDGEKTSDENLLSETISRISITSADSAIDDKFNDGSKIIKKQLDTPKNFRKVLFVCNL